MVIAVGAREVERVQVGKDPRSVHKMLMVPWATFTVWDKEMELAPFPLWKRRGTLNALSSGPCRLPSIHGYAGNFHVYKRLDNEKSSPGLKEGGTRASREGSMVW